VEDFPLAEYSQPVRHRPSTQRGPQDQPTSALGDLGDPLLAHSVMGNVGRTEPPSPWLGTGWDWPLFCRKWSVYVAVIPEDVMGQVGSTGGNRCMFLTFRHVLDPGTQGELGSFRELTPRVLQRVFLKFEEPV
jgi:hypothetical protein